MGQTPLGIEYPEPSSHTRLWELIQDTAESVDANVPLVQAGDALVDLGGSESGGVDITYPRAFSSTPIVVASPASVSGSTGNQTQYAAHVTNQSATGCRVTLRHYQAQTGTTTIGVTWVAVGAA